MAKISRGSRILTTSVLGVCLVSVAMHVGHAYYDRYLELPLLTTGGVSLRVGNETFTVSPTAGGSRRDAADALGAGAFCAARDELPLGCAEQLHARVHNLAAANYARVPLAKRARHWLLLKPNGELLPVLGVLATAVLLWAFSLGPEAEAERSMGPVLRRARAHGVDLLRLVLALVVLFSHAFAETGNQAVEPLGLLTGGQIWLGQLATNVFFALSGYFSEASLARRLRCTAAATAAAPVACVRGFLEARVRALVPLLSFFALVTAGALGPWLSGADYAAYSASAWRFIAALCAPFVTNTGPTATLGAGGLRGVPTLAGFERLPRAVDAVDFGIAGSLHTVQILWRCYLHIALLALCCAKRARDFRLAALIGGAWSACVLASGCGLLHVDVACFAIGAAYSASGASDAQRRGVFHRWQCAAATGPAVLGLAALLARRGDVSAAVALAVPFLLHWSLAAATAPCAERVGVALLGSIDPSGALATQVWIWGSLMQRIALRSTLLLAWSGGGAVAGGTDGSGVGGSGGRGKPFPSCVAVAEEEDLATLAGEMGRQLIEVERARCSVPSALAAFVMAAPLTLAAAVIAERARARWVHTDVFLGIAICVSVGRMFITS